MTCTLVHTAIIYHCDLTKEPLQPHIFREVTVKGFNPSDYQTTQVSPIGLPCQWPPHFRLKPVQLR